MDANETKPDSQEELKKISFPWGMPGLDEKEYTLINVNEESPFYYLQSFSEPEVALLLINPFVAYRDYEFDLPDEVTRQLKIKDSVQLAVFCTVNTNRGIDAATVNLLAPIVINTEDLLGKQVVLSDRKYSIRAPLAIIKGEREEGR